MRRVVLSIVCVSLFLFTPTAVTFQSLSANTSTSSLVIEVKGLRNNNGFVGALLFQNQTGFPEEKKNALKMTGSPIQNGQARLTFIGLESGEYAIAVIHDENKNQRMDFNMLRMPKEGLGFSRNPKIKFSAPDFNDCKFSVKNETEYLAIEIKYFAD